ncbi:ribosome biogenesis protein BOP1-like protein isoform X1 [Iris pallida]|uniref:Ribosome biogenesis protein BOP1-like protein isoform X1 n=1 Tax=Iris pallida TaxID=29817 RepID=A0AAX6E589_IRIPA|nr:ribosome biogenesis protein BOP1-like protein isoform X1 [Iris pallida]
MSSGTVLAYFAASTTTTNDSSGFSASHQEINIDPESLTPKVPNWKDLKPYHLTYYLEFQGHTGFVKSLFVQISGQWTTYGSTDELCACVVENGRCLKAKDFGGNVQHVAWNPFPDLHIFAVFL